VTDGTVNVRSISLYPIKSLDPIQVPAARILSSGALEHDREFALLDAEGNWINGKRDARIHRIRAGYDLEDLRVVTLGVDDSTQETFHLLENRRELEAWFGDFLGFHVLVKRNAAVGFPDDLESPGPTVVGSGTLREVSTWFEIEDAQRTHRRFRPNIEISSATPFWEDRLFGVADAKVEFRIGDVTVHGVNPCQRCVVPSRDPLTGSVTLEFQSRFAKKARTDVTRRGQQRARFNHYYRLAVNTRIPVSEAGKVVRVGDLVVPLG
jgi:uncharacterized protein YcbX